MAIQYYMRGYNTSAPGTVGYVDWVVNDIPDSTAAYVQAPYNPSNIINIIVNRIVPSKIDNFLKPFESLTAINAGSGFDGYFLHLNSYDWLNHTPPDTVVPIPVPSYMTGLSVVRGTVDGYTPRDYATIFWQEGPGQFKFALNTNGDDVTVGAALPVSMGSLAIDGYLAVGTDPAQSGIIRIPNSQYIVARNSTNTGDVPLIEADNVNRITVGSGSSAPVYMPGNLRVDGYIRDTTALTALSGFIRAGNGTTAVTFRDLTNSNDLAAVSSTGNIILIGSSIGGGTRHNANTGFVHAFQNSGTSTVEIGDNFVRFTSTVAFPIFTQTTTGIGNGQNLLVKAQTSTAGSSVGGSLILDTGNGTTSDGYVDLRVDNIPKIRVFGTAVPATPDFNDNSSNNPDSIQVFNPTIRFYDTVTAPTITQDTIGGALNGQPILIKAQRANSIARTGGDLRLSSGGGNAVLESAPAASHSLDGYVRLQTGTIDRVFIDATASRVTLTLNTFSFNASDGTFDAFAITNPVINQRNETANSATGQLFTLRAQTTTGTNSIGGSLNVGSGTGTLADGYVRIQTGTTTRALFDATANRATLTLATFAFNGLDGASDQFNVINPTIKQRDNTNASATGQTLTIQAQNAPNAGVGGNLVLASGLGASLAQDGYISFRTDSLTAGGKFYTDANGPFFSVGDSPSTPAATDGYFRVTNNVLALAARNSLNNANIRLAATNSSNRILLGNASDNTGFIFSTAVNSVYDFQVNAVSNKFMIGDGYVRFGAIPSVTGLVRSPNALTILSARNFLNNNDIPVIGTDASNNVVIGGAVNNVVIPGDLTVNGTTTTINSTVVDIADRVIHMNHSTGIVAVPTQITGFSIHRGSPDGVTPRDHAAMVWNESDGYWKLAFNTVGDDLTLTSALPLMTAAIVVMPTTTGNIATIGGLRVLNNTTAVASRNFANSADLAMLGTDGYDRIIIGANGTNAGGIFNTSANSVFDFQVAGVSDKVMVGDGYVRFGNRPSLIGNLRHSQASQAVTDIITARNAADTNDLKLLGVDGYDRISYGISTLNKGHIFDTATDGYYDFRVNGIPSAFIDGYKLAFKVGHRRHITPVSTTYPVLATDDYLAIDASSAYTITLPASPTLGDTYEFKDINGLAGTNNITIAGNGNNIDGLTNVVLNSNYTSLIITYTGTQWSVS